MATVDRTTRTWRARWLLVALGLVLIGLGVANAYVAEQRGYETYCGSLLNDTSWEHDSCASALTGRAVASGALALLGVGALAWGMSAWARGGRLLVAVLLAGVSVGSGLWSTQRVLHWDGCGIVVRPIEYSPGELPPGCGGVIPARRWQAGSLGLASVGVAAGSVLVVRGPRRPADTRATSVARPLTG